MQNNIATAGAGDEARAAHARRAPSNGVHRVVAFDRIQSSSGQVKTKARARVQAESRTAHGHNIGLRTALRLRILITVGQDPHPRLSLAVDNNASCVSIRDKNHKHENGK